MGSRSLFRVQEEHAVPCGPNIEWNADLLIKEDLSSILFYNDQWRSRVLYLFFKISISGSLTVNLHCQLDRFWNHLGDTLLWGRLQRPFTEKRSPALNAGSEISWIRAPNRVKSREEEGAHWTPASISFCFLTVTAVWPAFPAVMNSIYKWDEHKPFFLSLWVFFFPFVMCLVMAKRQRYQYREL